MQTFPYVERRKTPRLSFLDHDITLSIFDPSQKIVCSSRDLTVHGLRAYDTTGSLENLKPGQKVDVRFRIDHDHEIHTEGLICSKTVLSRLREGCQSLGMEFTSMSTDDRMTLLNFLSNKQLNDSSKIEYESLKKEMHRSSNTATIITSTVISLSLAYLGAILQSANKSLLLPLIPLALIHIGFEMYRMQHLRIRRNAAYIRTFVESQSADVNWEEDVADFRYVEREARRKRQRSFEYYTSASILASLCFSVSVWNFFTSQPGAPFNVLANWTNWSFESWATLVAWVVVWIYWNLLIGTIRKTNLKYTGGGNLEAEYLDVWNHIRAFKEGFCPYRQHAADLTRLIYNKRNIPRSEEEFRDYLAADAGGPLDENGERQLYCPYDSKISELLKYLRGQLKKAAGATPKKKFSLRKAVLRFERILEAVAFIVLMLAALIPGSFFLIQGIASVSNGLVAAEGKDLWKLLQFGGLVAAAGFIYCFFFVLRFKVKRVRHFYGIKKGDKKTWIDIHDWSDRDFAIRSVAPRYMSLPRWYFWFAWSRKWARERGSVYFLFISLVRRISKWPEPESPTGEQWLGMWIEPADNSVIIKPFS